MSATEWAEAINLAASEMTRANRAEARIEALERVLREIERKDTHPYIQIGDDPNFPGPTVMIPGQYAKIARAALAQTGEPIE